MEIWIKQGKEEIRLPVLPDSYEVASSQNNTLVTVNNIGEVNLLGKRNLRGISFSSFFPKQYYDFCKFKPKKPIEYVRAIEKMKKEGVIRLIITHVYNREATIESFTWGEEDGTGDISFTLEFKEYIKPKLISKKKKTSVNKTTKKVEKTDTKRFSKKVKTTIYIVKKGDTLSQISKKLTGSSLNYRAIANQNNIKNPNLIYPGQKLVIQIDN